MERPKLPTPTLEDYEHDKYVTTPENLIHTINKYGVAIIDNVLDKEECKALLKGFWEFLSHISQTWEVPIEKDNPESWTGFSKLLPLHSQLLQYYSIGQSQFIWDIRQNEKVLKIFSELWCVPVEDLLVSFDGASFHMPPEITKKGNFKGNVWMHTDQSPLRAGFECVQAWVTALDVNPGDATLTVLEGSNRFHDHISKRYKSKERKNWYKLTNQEQYDYFIKKLKCKRVCIKCPAGSMVFWDSRTMHAGQESLLKRKKQNFRCIAYLCYTPRELASAADIRKKIKAFEELRTTSHWPHKPTLFATKPRLYPGMKLPEITPIEAPVLTEIGYILAGY